MVRVPSITSARLSPAQDRHTRTTRYLTTMAIRLVCFVLAMTTPNPWRWWFAAGAVVLPYIAVVLANTGASRVARGIDEEVERAALARSPHELEQEDFGDE